MRHEQILLIGGSGFIGGHVAARLVQSGRSVVVPTRRLPNGRRLLPLPTLDLVQRDVHDDPQLNRLVAQCDAVVNCVGILHDRPGVPYGAGFRRAHVELPARIARACTAAGGRRLIHLSALGVELQTDTLPSMYLRSKADGERALRAAAMAHTTIFRPSVVFGPDDRFLNLFAGLAGLFPLLPLARAQARLQPVYVLDVAAALERALDEPETAGRTLELAGPEVFTLAELVKLAGAIAGHTPRIVALPDGLGRLQATLLEFAPGPTLMSRDNFDSLGVDNIAGSSSTAADGLALLGLEPASLRACAPGWLSPAASPLDEARRLAHR